MAFEKLAGIRPAVELATVARNYKQSGGSREAWIQAFDDAPEALRSAGQAKPVGNDQPGCAGAPQPMPHLGHVQVAKDGRFPSAEMRQPTPARAGSDSEPIPGAGHFKSAQLGQRQIAGAGNQITSGKATAIPSKRTNAEMPPAREPTDDYRKALADSAKATAKVQLELRMTSTGKAWGSIRPREFVGMVRDGDIAWAIQEAFGPFSQKQKDMELREFLPDEIFRKALTIAEVNHVGH